LTAYANMTRSFTRTNSKGLLARTSTFRAFADTTQASLNRLVGQPIAGKYKAQTL